MSEFPSPESIAERFPIAHRIELPVAELVTEDTWAEVHQEGYTWEVNLWGFIEEAGESVVVEIRDKDRLLIGHILQHDFKLGHPVTESYQAGRGYTVHHHRPGIAVYFKRVHAPSAALDHP